MRSCVTSASSAFLSHSNSLLCVLCASAVSISSAGPLTPPAGPIAPTPGPEPRIAINATNTPGDADSLFRITQPGSYYLTGNITGVAGKHGIEIAADDVTLDLGGFHLEGVPSMGDFDGVSAGGPSRSTISVFNGTIRGWGGHGIEFITLLVSAGRIERIIAHGNAGSGIRAGQGFLVSACSSGANMANGISAGIGSTIENCWASSNGSNGISANVQCTLSGCVAVFNNARGITTNSGCAITGCTARQNSGDGIFADADSTLTNCTATNNSSDGISVNFGAVVEGCTASANGLDGIQCTSGCVIRDNSCRGNGAPVDGAGIHVTSNDNRIEGNTCTGADRGIDVDAAGNIIIRNTCSGNTVNWDIVAGNAYGPIVATPAGAAVNGNTAAAALGSTDPNANFSY